MSEPQHRRKGAYNRGRPFRQKQRDGDYNHARRAEPRDERTEMERRIDAIQSRSQHATGGEQR